MTVSAIVQQFFNGVTSLEEARVRVHHAYDPPCLYRILRKHRDFTDVNSLIACQDSVKAECLGTEEDKEAIAHEMYTLTITLPPLTQYDEVHSRIDKVFTLAFGNKMIEPKIEIDASGVYKALKMRDVSTVDFVARTKFFARNSRWYFVAQYAHPKGVCVEFSRSNDRKYSIMTNCKVKDMGVACFADDFDFETHLKLDDLEIEILSALPDIS